MAVEEWASKWAEHGGDEQTARQRCARTRQDGGGDTRCPEVAIGRQNAAMATELDLDELTAHATAAAQGWAPGCTVSDVQTLTGGTSSLTFTAAVIGGPPGRGAHGLQGRPPGSSRCATATSPGKRGSCRARRRTRACACRPCTSRRTTATARGLALPRDEHRAGRVPRADAPGAAGGRDAARPDRAFAAAPMLAALHRVDPVAVGLAGEKETTLADEIKRWTRAFETVDDQMKRATSKPRRCCSRRCPPRCPNAICHGDYRLGNMLCDGGDVAALIDWEIWSLSDPRLDLAWFLFFTEEAEAPDGEQPRADRHADCAALSPRTSASRAPSPRTSIGSTPDPLQGGGRDGAAHQAGAEERHLGGARLGLLGDVDPGLHRRVHPHPRGLPAGRP